MSTIVWDMETDGLLGKLTKLHCIVSHHLETHKTYQYLDASEFVQNLNDGDTLVCHNELGFDLKALVKLGGMVDYRITEDGKAIIMYKDKTFIEVNIIDTLILSKLMNPDRGRHGLEAWGRRVGVKKPEIENWTDLDQETYLTRCDQDVKINVQVLDKLEQETWSI